MFLFIVLGLVWAGLFVAAVCCCGQPRIEQAQRMAGVQPGRKTTGKA